MGGDSWRAGTGKWDRKAEAKVSAHIEATVSLEPFLLGPQKNLSIGSKREQHLHPYAGRGSPIHHCWLEKLQYARKDYSGKPVSTRASALLPCSLPLPQPRAAARRARASAPPSHHKSIWPWTRQRLRIRQMRLELG